MVETRTYVSTPDPQLGTFLTPINNTPAIELFIKWLPINRPSISPLARGLEVGMAHGYWLVGPFTLLGPLRTQVAGPVAGLLASSAIILLMTIALSIYAYARPDGDNPVGTDIDWSNFASGFLIGGVGGAIVAYLLIENSDLITGLAQGLAG